MNVADNIKLPVKENQQLASLLIENFIVGHFKLKLQPLQNACAAVGEIQLGVRFHKVQHGVHGFIRHKPVFGQLVVGKLGFPVAGELFKICHIVGGMLLNQLKYLICKLKRFLIAACAVVACQCVDKKRLAVGVLDVVLNTAVIVHRPVHTAVFLIHTVFCQELISVARVVKQRRVFKLHICVGVEPEYPRMENYPFLPFLVNIEIAVHISLKAAVFVISQPVPERNYMTRKLIFYFFKHHDFATV